MNDAMRNDTYLGRAVADAEGGGGRFAAIGKSKVIGATPAVQYPPAAGPWSDPVRVPEEPPLGHCVDDLEPSGEAFEVERSLASLGEVVAPAGVAPPTVETASLTPTPIKRRRL